MSWRDDLRKVTITINGKQRTLIGASFRGVPFLVESEERSGGRRAVVHEFPYRDEPFVEDLGKKAGTLRVEAYVLGDDYLIQRDNVVSACEDTPGPGELVLPGHGVKRAICTVNSERQTKTDGGIAMLALEFVETPAQAPAPTSIVDGAAQVADMADATFEASSAELVETFDSAGMPAFALESAQTALKNAAAGLAAKLSPIISATQELATFTGEIDLMTAEAASLVRSPADALTGFHDAILGLVDTILAAPKAVFDALVEAYFVDLGETVVATTATRARELENQKALIGALRRAIAIEAARLAPLIPYESIDDAITARDQVGALLDDQADSAGDTAYPSIVELAAAVRRHVPGASSFASVATVSLKEPIPSILLAYKLYGSTDKELDIVARNKIAHPGFVVGDLKVLSDG